ncbi:N-acetyl-gamma-glutamyl-phosphate reductase [Roseomonas mucosa]|uniref:N-acetyl-gamma-glutamyl-phosphate reductase n=1 Tax=Roseomonas mucosa TaxID=207340 RepID=UPI0028CD046D|nr:N-acetyl-gamma-glutamyl-phosphate reductase [Roseomonas mucosa]MDT8277311.1 N-acetyl-gamma-glutamyl-phosphate reductase [Roseomonas mucosa]MDT8354156.1 N-acetyl-gamma-glutamyl-phosphate reductase [Roseomonas mucosa]
MAKGSLPSVFVDGESGTTGLQIVERLQDLPGVALRSLPAERRKDPEAKRALMAEVDAVVLCLPDDAAKESAAMAASLGADAPKVLDASTAHRVDPDWVYGFPELSPEQAAAVARAPRVSNPGCYPTGGIALLRPLVDAGLIPADYPVTVNAVSGYSGGGKAMIAEHETGKAPNFELYGLGLEHKHVAELQRYSGLTRRPLFVPSVGHFRQGMLVSIPLHLDTLPGKPSPADLRAALEARYADFPWVHVLPAEANGKLEAEALNDTNSLELRVFGSDARGQAVLVARLDNLGKGASGAAVQNLGLMLGLDVEARLGRAA